MTNNTPAAVLCKTKQGGRPATLPPDAKRRHIWATAAEMQALYALLRQIREGAGNGTAA